MEAGSFIQLQVISTQLNERHHNMSGTVVGVGDNDVVGDVVQDAGRSVVIDMGTAVVNVERADHIRLSATLIYVQLSMVPVKNVSQ